MGTWQELLTLTLICAITAEVTSPGQLETKELFCLSVPSSILTALTQQALLGLAALGCETKEPFTMSKIRCPWKRSLADGFTFPRPWGKGICRAHV